MALHLAGARPSFSLGGAGAKCVACGPIGHTRATSVLHPAPVPICMSQSWLACSEAENILDSDTGFHVHLAAVGSHLFSSPRSKAALLASLPEEWAWGGA